MSTTVDQIKSRLSIIDVVSSYIKLQKAGVNYKALCPFHNEKTPSMSISPERGSFHCFGCNKGGDIFTFVQEMEGLDFVGALKVLAERAGVEITWDGKKENRDEKERLYEVLQAAADFFHSTLTKNKEALLYLKNRGLLASTAEDFYLGFAGDPSALLGAISWDALYEHLIAEKYSGEEMEKAGLVLRAKEGTRLRQGYGGQGRRYYDRFRSRIMFPLADSAGRVVGFSGRIFLKEGSEKESEMGAKYVNSPETVLYNKSKILYGLHKAKQAIREKGFVVVVEGQMDLLMSHQAGVRNAVAVSGTALSDEHLKTLKRFSDKVVFAFDSDSAGQAAAKRAGVMALRLGMDVRAARIMSGKDPADLIHELKDAWLSTVEDAKHIILFFLDILKAKDAEIGREKDKRAFRLSVEKEIFPLIAAITSAVDREHFIEVVAKEISLSPDTVREGIMQNKQEDFRESGAPSQRKTTVRKATRKTIVERELVGLILWKKDETMQKKYEDLISKYDHIPFLTVSPLSPEEARALVFSSEKMYGSSKDAQNLMELGRELLYALEEELLKEKRNRLTAALREESDEARSGVLQKQYVEITRLLEEVKKRSY